MTLTGSESVRAAMSTAATVLAATPSSPGMSRSAPPSTSSSAIAMPLRNGGLGLGPGERVLLVDPPAAAPDLVRAQLLRGGGVHREVEQPAAGADRAGQRADRRAAGLGQLEHPGGGLGRVRRDAGVGDAVLAGEHDDAGAVGVPGRRGALRAGQPDGQLVEPAERVGGAGQRVEPLPGRGRGLGVERLDEGGQRVQVELCGHGVPPSMPAGDATRPSSAPTHPRHRPPRPRAGAAGGKGRAAR